MTLDKKLKELQPIVKEKLDHIAYAKHYDRLRIWVEQLEKVGYDVEFYKGVLKGGK